MENQVTNQAIKTIELAVLEVIARGGGEFGPTEYYWYFHSIMSETGLTREYVRAACRSLTDQGYAEFSAALTNVDGIPAGAGYSATRLGIQYLEEYHQNNYKQGM